MKNNEIAKAYLREKSELIKKDFEKPVYLTPSFLAEVLNDFSLQMVKCFDSWKDKEGWEVKIRHDNEIIYLNLTSEDIEYKDFHELFNLFLESDPTGTT